MFQAIEPGMKIRHQSGRIFEVTKVSATLHTNKASQVEYTVDVTFTSNGDRTEIRIEEVRRMLMEGEATVVERESIEDWKIEAFQVMSELVDFCKLNDTKWYRSSLVQRMEGLLRNA